MNVNVNVTNVIKIKTNQYVMYFKNSQHWLKSVHIYIDVVHI